jgi:hypothetical protein
MNVRLQYTIPFTAGVYYDNRLCMNNYTLTLYMMTNSTDPDEHDTSFERIKYFVNAKIDSTIFINSEQVEQCKKYLSAGIDITTMPGEPVDQLVGIMLYHKLNAITEDRMIILETEISSQFGGNMIYIHGDSENIDTVVFPPWWETADLTHCDIDLVNVDKVVSVHLNNAWRDLDLSWPDVEGIVPEDNTVVFADFGKDETK